MLKVWQGQQVPSMFRVLCQFPDEIGGSFCFSILNLVSYKLRKVIAVGLQNFMIIMLTLQESLKQPDKQNRIEA